MNKLLAILVVSLSLTIKVQAQIDSGIVIIDYMSSAPTFGQGTASNFLLWLYQNIEYPKFALIDSISGKVFAKFLIDSTGTVNNIRILKGVRYDLDSAVTRVLRSSPKWIPAKQGNNNIGVPFIVQIQFDAKDPYFMNQIQSYSKRASRRKSTNH
jgi:protein TonB